MSEVMLGARVPQALYDKVVAEQAKAKKITGIEPSISQVVRLLLERGLEASRKR